jgi:hypothetical protein
MGYFDNLDNGNLKRIQKYIYIKNRKKFIIFFNLRLIVFQISYNLVII